jgi:hypothetical protein
MMPTETQVAFAVQGEEIFGVLHVPGTIPAPGVVMCHGFTGHKAETHRLFVTAAREFCEAGMVVLRFDFRGSGDSAGEFRDMTISREIEDAQAAVRFLSSRVEVDAERIGALGLSLGGGVAACLSGRERLQALVLWAAVAHPGRQFEHRFPDFGEEGWVDMQGWGLGRAFAEDTLNVHPLAEVTRHAGPVLIVHGAKDESVLPSDAQDYKDAIGERAELRYIEGADHTFSSFPWKGEAISASRQFFVKTLGAKA